MVVTWNGILLRNKTKQESAIHKHKILNQSSKCLQRIYLIHCVNICSTNLKINLFSMFLKKWNNISACLIKHIKTCYVNCKISPSPLPSRNKQKPKSNSSEFQRCLAQVIKVNNPSSSSIKYIIKNERMRIHSVCTIGTSVEIAS